MGGWPRGDAPAGAPAQRHTMSVKAPALPRGDAATADLLAALSLVLTRCGAGDMPMVLLDGHGGESDRIRAVPVGMPAADGTVGEYRKAASRRIEAALQVAGAAADPAVGLCLTTGSNPARASALPVHPITVQVDVAGDGRWRTDWWYGPDQVPGWWVEELAGLFATALDVLTGGVQDGPVDELALLDAEGRDRVLRLGGRPADAAPELVHERFRKVAAQNPAAVALTDGAARMTYGELDALTDRAAAALRTAGVRTGDRVGVCLDRGIDLPVALLAVLKAGAAYVPLDPGYPEARLSFLVQDAGLTHVVVDGRGAARLPAAGTLIPWPEVLATSSRDDAPEPPGADGAGSAATAYVIYTSGSTGRPKGVVVPHRNVVALIDAVRDDFGLGRDDTWSWFHSAAFDFSVWEIWGCLLSGGRLVVVPYWTCRSPEQFRELLAREAVTVLSQTPSAFAGLLELERRGGPTLPLRLVVFGGEPLDTRSLLPWFDRYPPSRCRLVNMFGITETTVHVTAETLGREHAETGSRCVGAPIPGWAVRVVDPAGRLVPPGVVGEIAVAGAGLADGYLHRAQLTAQRFVLDRQSGERWYLSGDRGRLLPDGRLEHLGRIDGQVKLRGHRIEPDEIRGVLLEDPAVVAAAVVLRSGIAEAARLDAYVVLAAGTGPDTVAAIRRRASETLPEYMVPATVTALPVLPLTVNGKLDVSALPEPDLRTVDPASGPPVTPTGNDVVDALLGVCRSLLGSALRPDDNFFDAGGNSLLLARLAGALRAGGFPGATVRALYLHPTARRLADHLAGTPAGGTASIRGNQAP
ncbi:amino acid adenylation domain-containing protein [Actinoplanes sp. NPDC049681]|uniref:amino acid adenylation domain-containing protein n=1 Tax=Actinoplanes sp. NPDC049681 TaxID=3363905 RepID=UPI0037BA1560